MSDTTMKIMDGNEAAARVAHAVSEVIAIYPITPSTSMGELSDEWSAKGVKNIWGTIPSVAEMQSEGGAIGSLHGAAQTGALTTTFTASQGLLLMIPNMYKLAGELIPTVLHVTARALAAQALSIFGDHSDVMAVRSTGFAMLSSASVQEAQDFAAIAHAATLMARIPFVHFFDGFRVSHEINKIFPLSNEQIAAMLDDDLIAAHRARALNPDHPVIRGTAQNPDVYFQGREAANNFYTQIPAIVEQCMEKFAKLTSRKYNLVDYYGAPNAEHIIIIMGSGAKVTQSTVEYLQKQGEKIGVIQLNLFRPFPLKQFIAAIPLTTQKIAVLDRTKEPGALGEPLYQDIVTALAEAGRSNIQVIGGRYGLSSKEFTPAMVKAIFDELNKAQSKNHFTIGINDDVTHTSLAYDGHLAIEDPTMVQAIFYGLGSDGTVGANKNSVKIIGDIPDKFAQAYFVYDSKKAGSRTTSHLRFGPKPINAPYLIQQANFIGCHQFNFLDAIDILGRAANGATFLLNSPYKAEEVWQHLPKNIQQNILDKKLQFYVIDAYKVARVVDLGSRINTIMQTCFFAISGVLPRDEAIAKIKESVVKTYKRKGDEVVQKNFTAIDKTLENLHQVTVPADATTNGHVQPPVVSNKAPEFVQQVTAVMMADRGEELPVSAMPVDGTYPTATTQWEKRNVSQFASNWNADLCIQCGQCSMVCPHGIIRVKHCAPKDLANAPEKFKSAKLRAKGYPEDERFTLQINLEDCTGCDLCHMTCPAASKENPSIKAIMLKVKDPILEQERKNLEFFDTLPYNDRTVIDSSSVRGAQFLRPLFEFSSACAGCGETPYIRLVSQLFGDRMLVANATGCSSIYGGNLPTTPWCQDCKGRGPAWANSLFEDNAEFGFGYRLSVDKQQEFAVEIITELASTIGIDLVNAIKTGCKANTETEIAAQRQRVAELRAKITTDNNPRVKLLLSIIESLVPRSVWIIGGDGWAYDIGYGGLDHVVAQGRNVNILVLDTEVYSNTGGQSSKATPRSAIAKFASSGKNTSRKDLALITMSYTNVYVAQIALEANPTHALKAIKEAEAYPGTSLIIAYSNCISHGYNMRQSIEQQKAAVASAFWPLFRYNPTKREQGLNPFQLDSQAPTIQVAEYAYNEPRFKVLQTNNPEHAAVLMQQLQEDVNNKWKLYTEMAK